MSVTPNTLFHTAASICMQYKFRIAEKQNMSHHSDIHLFVHILTPLRYFSFLLTIQQNKSESAAAPSL